jgi:hypothetical protein
MINSAATDLGAVMTAGVSVTGSTASGLVMAGLTAFRTDFIFCISFRTSVSRVVVKSGLKPAQGQAGHSVNSKKWASWAEMGTGRLLSEI